MGRAPGDTGHGPWTLSTLHGSTPPSCSIRKATWRPGPERRRRRRTARERPRRKRGRRKRRASRLPGRASARASPEVGVSAGSSHVCALAALPTLTHRSVPAGGKGGAGSPGGTPKKSKVEPYSLTAQQSSLIKEDESNTKLWSEILKSLKDGPVSPPPPQPPPHPSWATSSHLHLCSKIETVHHLNHL